MSGTLLLGAYWKSRQQSIEQCADRLSAFLAQIPDCDETFTSWYEPGKSRHQALQKRVDAESKHCIRDLVSRSRNRRDTDGSVIEELGFHVGLWNGREGVDAASLSVSCGIVSKALVNSLVLRFPTSFVEETSRREHVVGILRLTATLWDPDWAGVMSHEAMKARKFNARMPFVDWMLYVSNRILPCVPLIEVPTTVEAIDGFGSLFIVQREPPNPYNRDDLRNIGRLEGALHRLL